MNEIHIKIVCLQITKRSFERRHHTFAAELRRPDLAADKELFSFYRIFRECLADLGFVLIHPRGIDISVACVESILYDVLTALCSRQIRTVTDCGDSNTVR